VDWYLDSGDVAATSDLRREIRSYLERHAAAPGSVGDAELAVSELLANGARHATGPLWVSLRWSGARPVMTVADLGPGFELDPSLPDDDTSVGGRGLFIVQQLTGDLEAAARRGGGMRIQVTLPVDRAPSASHDPPRNHRDALPRLDEARPEGGFSKEPFLRALVVQMAQTVERDSGPSAAEAVVAQVGTDVGGQMEAEYRAATDVTSRLTPEQIAECYVRLKAAIDGGFHVEEANEKRIVLVNDRCPFGEVVRRAPALCRMTSSVFGGIAARNTDDGALVVLEERIAVGDPGCRVVVWLDPGEADLDPDGRHPHGHRYLTPSDPA
jgi:anti-sigma regulatory factor (Ser/Thr protein kinase)